MEGRFQSRVGSGADLQKVHWEMGSGSRGRSGVDGNHGRIQDKASGQHPQKTSNIFFFTREPRSQIYGLLRENGHLVLDD